MKLSDLRTGMIVTIRCGREYLVVNDKNAASVKGFGSGILINIADGTWDALTHYNQDFFHENVPEFDIVKVEKPLHCSSFIDMDYGRDSRELLWSESRPTIEVTIEEIESKFGCRVKIVG